MPKLKSALYILVKIPTAHKKILDNFGSKLEMLAFEKLYQFLTFKCIEQ